MARLDRAIQREIVDYPVKSDADFREEVLRPDNDSHWNRGRYIKYRPVLAHKKSGALQSRFFNQIC